jgi:1,4-dihydroxy-2-naphthoate octaprenyltransferase
MQAWWLAARPKTLLAGLAPVLVGTAVAHAYGGIRPLPAAAAALGSILIQIGTNLANDYFDHKKGADTEDRVGPDRAVQQGWISPSAMLAATVAVLLAALGVGVYLIGIGGAPIAAIGVASLICAIAYTGGPYPLAYVGLGDVFVFVFFGLAAVVGTIWV